MQGNPAWTVVNTGLTNTVVYTLLTKNDTIFAGTYGGGVFRSADNGATWAAVNAGLSAARVTSFVKSGNALVAGTYGAGAFNKVNGGNNGPRSTPA